MPRYTAVLDACVLVPVVLADTLRVAEDDRHVVAAAVRGGAQGIITANAKDFPAAALEPLGLEAVHPDDFLLDQLDLSPLEALGIVPDRPLPCWGWGDIPDQYGRDWNGDDGSTPMPPPPDGLADLPPILPWWEPQPWRARKGTPASAVEVRYRDLTS